MGRVDKKPVIELGYMIQSEKGDEVRMGYKVSNMILMKHQCFIIDTYCLSHIS